MKRKMHSALTVILAVALAAMLAACAKKDAGPNTAASPSASPNATPKELTAAEVFEKSLAASGKLNSFSAKVNMNQQMEQGSDKIGFTTGIDMDVVLKPEKALSEKIKMTMLGQDTNTEMYYTKDGLFLKDPQSGQWSKLPAADLETQMSAFSDEQLNPSKQLEQLKQFVSDFTVEKTEQDYIMKLSAAGDKYKDYILNEIQKSSTDEATTKEMLDQMKNMKINKVDITYTVDNNAFNPQAMKMLLDVNMDIAGSPMHMVTDMNGAYSDHNSVKPVVVPQEALNAKPAQNPGQ